MLIPLEFQPDHELSGTAISVPFGLYRHYGLLFYIDGAFVVVSNSASARGVEVQSFQDFVGTKEWRNDGYLGQLPWREVFLRATSMTRLYDPIQWNCEHFITYCHGLPPTSRQLRATTAIAALLIAGITLANAA